MPPSPSLIACRECDSLHRRVPLAVGESAHCLRCGAELYRRPRLHPEQMLAISLTALITLIIANCLPIIDMSINGIPSSTTLLGSILVLFDEGRLTLAALVLGTGMLFPLLDVTLMLALLLTPGRPRLQAPLFRLVSALRPWGMTEVFVLGVLVSLVKLSHSARVVAGGALWAFGLSAFLLLVMAHFDLRRLMDEAQ